MQNNDVTYFDSFVVEHILKEIRIQAYDSIVCAYFCIRFIDFMLAGNTLTEFTNLFSTNNFKKMMIQF